MSSRRFHIDNLIINSPFAEPSRHWRYIREDRMFELVEDGRRPAGYLVASAQSHGFDDPGLFMELPLVNHIRPRVKAWRQEGYPGVSGVTRRLLEHWNDPAERQYRFFFCQLEAIETLIWLTEASASERQGISIPGDGGLFTRICLKMATGSGKTIVMAMLIAWQALNRNAYPQDSRYSRNFLAVAPGLTVKSRLQVLVPDSPGNYYQEFSIVPPGMIDGLRQARVMIVNWHKLDWDTEEQIARRRSVDKRGPKSDEAYVRQVLGDMATARNIVVINDEAHHAWRVSGGREKGIDKAALEEATKWIGGLDRIHRARGVLTAFDFSATPFVPSGKKSTEEALFGWIVSDFGLNDAIESGLVKTPRVVVRDDGRQTKELKSRLYHIYMDAEVKDDLNRKAEEHVPLPDLVVNGYYFLGLDWRETAKRWLEVGHKVPPVMITVANRTETAARVKYAFDNGKIRIDELRNPERTLHIDSKVLDKAEAADEPAALSIPTDAETGEEDATPDDDAAAGPRKKLTRQQEAERLRQIVDTVGRQGMPGEQIQSVISVGMLSEGWDAKTVTHIMGLRAFSSQLLCEQVVGRGLRRTSYEMKEGTDLFEPEYVNVFGVPFTFMHHEAGDGPPPPPPPPKTLIEPRPEKKRFAISWPNITRIDHVYRPKLQLDLGRTRPLRLNATETATIAELAPVIDGKPDPSMVSDINLMQLAVKYRTQKIIFETARDVFDQMKPGWQGGRDHLLAQLIGLVERFVHCGRIEIEPALFMQDEMRRRIIITLNMNKLVQHIWEEIRFENSAGLELVFDDEQPIRGTGDMHAWYTGRPCAPAARSHINHCVCDSTWEASNGFRLDRHERVEAWVKNDHLGFDVLYLFNGVRQKYRPDFLIRLTGGLMLVLETKGVDTQQDQSKREFLAEWVKAVNEHGGFGRWACDVSRDPADIEEILDKHAMDQGALS